MPDLTRAMGEEVGHTLNGKRYILSPVTVGDLAAFEAKCKEDRVAAFMGAAQRVNMPEEKQYENLNRILTMPFTNEDLTSGLSSTDGIRFLVHRSISKKQPDFNMDEVDNISDIEELMEVITAISSLGRMADAESDPTKTKKTRAKRQS